MLRSLVGSEMCIRDSVASASAALACVLIGLGYVSMREPATPEQLAPVTPEVVAEVEAAATVEEAPITEPAPIDRPDIIADVITADDLTSAPAVVDEEPFTQNLPTLEIADPAVALVEAAQIEDDCVFLLRKLATFQSDFYCLCRILLASPRGHSDFHRTQQLA